MDFRGDFKNACEGYSMESICVLLQLFGISCVAGVIVALFDCDVKIKLLVAIVIPVIAFLGLAFTTCRTALLSAVDRIFNLTVTKQLVFTKIKDDWSGSSRWDNSLICKFYDKKLIVDRRKLICKDEMGKRVVLRSVMSSKKCQAIASKIDANSGWEETVTYGKLSHIILKYESKDDFSRMLNRKL